MPSPFEFFSIALPITIIIILYRYLYLKKVKNLSWDIIDALNNETTTAALYSQQLTNLVYSAERQEGFSPDFTLLAALKDTTVNGYYVIKEIARISDSQYLVIADIFTFIDRRNSMIKWKAQPGDENMLYTSHIFIKQESLNKISFYSVAAIDKIHQEHLFDFSRFLLHYINKREYTFSIEAL